MKHPLFDLVVEELNEHYTNNDTNFQKRKIFFSLKLQMKQATFFVTKFKSRVYILTKQQLVALSSHEKVF